MLLDKQKIIKSSIVTSTSNINYSDIQGDNKLSIVEFSVDKPNFVSFNSSRPATKIEIRQDILGDLTSIKEELGYHGISLSCDVSYVDLNLNPSSDFAKVGLEVKLYSTFALSTYASYDQDDYFVGPTNSLYDKTLTVYGLVRSSSPLSKASYKSSKAIYEIYNIKETYKKTKPNIVRVFKNFLNITKLFNDYGFKQPKPQKEFFDNSIVEKSNWNVFQKTSLIKLGMSNKDLLETVYVRGNTGIWLQKDKYWDGEKFND